MRKEEAKDEHDKMKSMRMATEEEYGNRGRRIKRT